MSSLEDGIDIDGNEVKCSDELQEAKAIIMLSLEIKPVKSPWAQKTWMKRLGTTGIFRAYE